MKINPVNFNGINLSHKLSQNKESETIINSELPQINDLSGMPYIYPITFTSAANSSKIRILFSYGLPCIYSGLPMIDPKVLHKMMKNKLFNRPAIEVIDTLDKYKDSFVGIEKDVLNIIRDRARFHPEFTIKQILKEVEPLHKRKLRKLQTPVFHKLSDEIQQLPDKYRYKFNALMKETENKLDEKPVMIPFSAYEFKYRLSKIAENIEQGHDVKSRKVLNKMLREANRFSNKTSDKTLENQKRVLNFIDIIHKKSVLKHNVQLKELIQTSKSRLMQQEIIIPFSRKNFLYDFAKIIEDLPDNNLKARLMAIAQKLPTSKESTSAFILKVASEPVDKIGHRLVWPSLASVEHILPKSCNGANEMFNYAGARTVENSDRKNISFVQQINRRPLTPEFCQKYIDRLIELYHKGVFRLHNIDPKYIQDIARTFEVQSRGIIRPDLIKLFDSPVSKMNEVDFANIKKSKIAEIIRALQDNISE